MAALNQGLATALFISAFAPSAFADVCDYRPSELLGGTSSGAVAASGAAVAGSGMALNAAGFYTLTNAVTGATMLASTAGGVSAAGTVGIMGGTAGVIGTGAAILTAPATITAGAVLAVGSVGVEGVCYFQDERVTDFYKVLGNSILLSNHFDPSVFRVEVPKGAAEASRLFVRKGNGTFDVYNVSDLYFVNGVLKSSDWFADTTIADTRLLWRTAIKN